MNTKSFSISPNSPRSNKSRLTLNAAALAAAAAGGASIMYLVLPKPEPKIDDNHKDEGETGEETGTTTDEGLDDTNSVNQSPSQTGNTSQTGTSNSQQHNPNTPSNTGTSDVDPDAVAMQIAQSVEIDPDDSANPTEVVFDHMGMVYTPDGGSHNAIWVHTADGQEYAIVDMNNTDQFNVVFTPAGEYVAQSQITYHASDFQIYTNPDGDYLAYNPSIRPVDPTEHDVIRTDGKEEPHEPNGTQHQDDPTDPEVDFEELLNFLLNSNPDVGEVDSQGRIDDTDNDFAYIDDARGSDYPDDDDDDIDLV